VAGTIGAVGNNALGVAGVAWEVTLVPLRFIGGNGLGTLADAAEAIDYATEAGVDVISASWGTTSFSITLLDAIREATDAGILFVAAAGNAGVDADAYPHYPSGYDDPGIVAVAATDDQDSLATFSSYGAVTVDLAAPGVSILSTVPSGEYARLSGTSMAVPHVSGVAALLRGVAPRIGVESLKQKILGSVDAIPGLSGRTVSGGRLNAFRVFSDRETTPPGACADLIVSSPDSFSLTLNWTATGDDGAAGTASYYDVRYSTSPFDAAGFGSALRARRPSPRAAARAWWSKGWPPARPITSPSSRSTTGGTRDRCPPWRAARHSILPMAGSIRAA
jgi:subtilisin family serine protease